MEIQSLFGDVPVAKFVDEYLHRLPFALAGVGSSVREAGTWDALGPMLAKAGSDAFAVRSGEWFAGDLPRSAEAAQQLVAEGYTVFVRHAERHHSHIAEIAEAFEGAFEGPVNVHVFATPAGAPGFSWHYDAEDVFILQTTGEKEYSLRKNTVNPWPLEETLPADMQYEREQMPLMRVLLRGGDLLYVPCGYWHKAEARGNPPSPGFLPKGEGGKGEAAISLAVGVMSRSAMDVYEFLRKRLVQSLVWRQRLPLVGAASPRTRDELEATYRQIFSQLAGDMARTLAEPRLVTEFLDARRTPEEPSKGSVEEP
jgi:50S ribosomal protein L16 3-hydroxylase